MAGTFTGMVRSRRLFSCDIFTLSGAEHQQHQGETHCLSTIEE